MSHERSHWFSLLGERFSAHRRFGPLVVFTLLSFLPLSVWSDDEPYLEPGVLRLSHTLNLEGVFHAARPDQRVTDDGHRNKIYTPDSTANDPWKADWGESLETEAAARFSKATSARVLFDVQGDYADRYWDPINYAHDRDQNNAHVFLEQYEGGVKEDNWYLQGFSGVARDGWANKGDIFGFYKGEYPDRDYLGSSGYFGIYPKNWDKNQILNISRRRVPQGTTAGGTWNGWEADAAYGSELDWGVNHSGYGRVSYPVGSTRLNLIYKNNGVPYVYRQLDSERMRAYEATWTKDSPEELSFGLGILYQPFRIGDDYQVDRSVDGGSGLLGSTHEIGTKTVKRSDALGGKADVDGYFPIREHVFNAAVGAEREGVVAGNKEQANVRLGTDFGSFFKGSIDYTYRRPIEGPLPFLYQGTPDNIGAIVSNPRGPDSPFTVGWDNREASLLVTTIQFDPTPGSSLLTMNQTDLALWNVNPHEDADIAIAFQHRMSDYKTPTDRQYYYDETGTVVWESAAHSGAWATRTPLHDFRLLAVGNRRSWKWVVGLAGGQSPAISGVAYSTSTTWNKPITEYFSIETRIEMRRVAYWAHYGSGVWGPMENLNPYFGESYDRLFGAGVSYNVTPYTTWDLSYLGARQKDDLFRPPSLGSFDEIRTVLSHRFGFVLQFKEPLRPGTDVR